MTPEQRHTCMSHIRGKNTSPEMVVRRYLHGEGFRYSLHNRRLPGKPDLVLRKYRTVIMVNGCFWHGHVIADNEPCPYFKLPKGNADFWRHKIQLNQARDLRERVELRNMGWHVIVVWECQLKTAQRDATLHGLKDLLLQLYLDDHRLAPRPYRSEEEAQQLMVAEEGD